MRDYSLMLEPFITVNVLSCVVKEALNDHAYLHFSGHIRSEDEPQYMKLGLSDTQVTLRMKGEDGDEYIRFCGFATDVQIQREGDLCVLQIDAVSGSYMLDMVRHTRIFQNTSSTYDDLLKHNERSYQNAGHLMSVGNGTQIQELIVQYHETDWAFARRLASHFHSCVVPAYRKSGIHVCFGLPKEVLFTPDSLIFTNNNGMSVEILDEEGIRIISDKTVLIQSGHAIQIASTEQFVHVIAPTAITLTQGQTKMTIQDEIHLEGAQIHME